MGKPLEKKLEGVSTSTSKENVERKEKEDLNHTQLVRLKWGEVDITTTIAI
jgi:hypothetical protein